MTDVLGTLSRAFNNASKISNHQIHRTPGMYHIRQQMHFVTSLLHQPNVDKWQSFIWQFTPMSIRPYIYVLASCSTLSSTESWRPSNASIRLNSLYSMDVVVALLLWLLLRLPLAVLVLLPMPSLSFLSLWSLSALRLTAPTPSAVATTTLESISTWWLRRRDVDDVFARVALWNVKLQMNEMEGILK